MPAPNGAALPPNDSSALATLYDPALTAFGGRLDRGSLVDESVTGAPSSAQHLALYVASTGGVGADGLASSLLDASALIGSDVFSRWAGVQSFDVCILGPGAEGAAGVTVARLRATRGAGASLKWADLSLEDLAVVTRSVAGLSLEIAPSMADSGLWRQADEAATRRTGRPLPATSKITR